LFSFDRERRRFRLESVHPGHSQAEIIEHTGFQFEQAERVPLTAAPSSETLRLLRSQIAPELAETYPRFAQEVFGVAQAG
jgi:glutaconate CoA-transferase subunit B